MKRKWCVFQLTSRSSSAGDTTVADVSFLGIDGNMLGDGLSEASAGPDIVPQEGIIRGWVNPSVKSCHPHHRGPCEARDGTESMLVTWGTVIVQAPPPPGRWP